MLGRYVEALALANHYVVESKVRIEQNESMKLNLIQAGDIEAAEAAELQIRGLKTDLRSLEAILAVAAYRVGDAFNAAIGYHLPSMELGLTKTSLVMRPQ